ncbi:hypothetical protein [Tenacibaculum sp.]|uniref:hypothetical protein n=1 Tax=Tenacibaculum sp. TaxID=1906242 RepID=UPI003D117864
MATTIAHNSRETISRLIRKEFDECPWWDFQKMDELINTAKSYGLDGLASEMKNDLN